MSLTDPPLSESQIEGLRQRASVFERSTEVTRDDMSLAFEPTWAADLELQVGGDVFFPRIGADEHSVHINQFGYKSDALGLDATALLVADGKGSKPWSSSRSVCRDLADAGVEIVVNQGFPSSPSVYSAAATSYVRPTWGPVPPR